MARAALPRSLAAILVAGGLIGAGLLLWKRSGGGGDSAAASPSPPDAGTMATPGEPAGPEPSEKPLPPAPPPRPDALLWKRWSGRPMAEILKGLEAEQPPSPPPPSRSMALPSPSPATVATDPLLPGFAPVASPPAWPPADDLARVGSGIAFSAERTPLAWWSFDSGAPLDATASSGLGSFPGGTRLLPADYDRDGDLDLFIGRRGDWPDSLLRREGGDSPSYEEVTEAAGLLEFLDLAAAAWVDYDRDGWLDLFIAQRPPAGSPDSLLRLYRNGGDGTFTDVATAAGLAGSGEVRDALWRDLDDDGHPDLLLSLAGSPGRLRWWRSLAAEGSEGTRGEAAVPSRRFEEATAAAGLEGIPGGGPLAAADFDADGRDDLAVAAEGILSLLTASPDTPGTFVDRSPDLALSGVPGPTVLAAEDLDLDGLVDLVVAGGTDTAPLTRAWANPGDLPSRELPEAAGLGSAGLIRTLRPIDPSGSVRPSWLLGGGPGWHSAWLTHRSPLAAERRRIALRLRAPETANPQGLGARITVSHRDRNWVYRSQTLTVDEPEEILGLDGAVAVESIEIVWPDRERSRTRVESLAVDHHHEIGPGPGDLRSAPLPGPRP